MQLFQAAFHGLCTQGYVDLHLHNFGTIAKAMVVAGECCCWWFGEQMIVIDPPRPKRLRVYIAEVPIEVSAGTTATICAGIAIILVMPQIQPPIVIDRAFPRGCAPIWRCRCFMQTVHAAELRRSVFEGRRGA